MKVFCSCGCGNTLEHKDDRGRLRSFVHGHNPVKLYGTHKRNVALNGYIRLGARVYEHRYIMEQHIGRKLKRWEQVHHINGNRKDNRLENLRIVSQGEHSAIHKALGAYKNNGRKVCQNF